MGRTEVPETLDTLGRALVAALAEQTTGVQEYVARQIRAAHDALCTAARRLAAPSVGAPPDPAIIATWLHEVRGSVNAMVGWSRMLGVRPQDEATRLRTVETIERNAKLLMELLSRPPV